MLIIALVLAVIGLAALVTAVVTSNELIAWVCIGASVIGVVLLIVDALRERSRGADTDSDTASGTEAETEQFDADYPDDTDTVTASDDAEAVAGENDSGDADAVPFDERHEDPREDEPAVGDRNTP
jgi:hypothetical protein